MLLAALAGCSGSTTLNGANKKADSKGSANNDQNGANGNDDGSTQQTDGVTDPQEVAGAFLTCDKIAEQCGTGPTAIGCSMMDSTTKKMLDSSQYSFSLALYKDKEETQPEPMTSTQAGTSYPQYNVMGSLPADACETGYVVATATPVAGGKAITAQQATAAMNELSQGLTTLGTTATAAGAAASDGTTGSSSASCMSDFQYDLSWSSGNGFIDTLWDLSGIVTAGFCDSSGNLAQGQLRPDWANILSSMFPDTNYNTKVDNTSGTITQPSSLMQFKVNGGSDDYSHNNDGCFFVVDTNHKVYVASQKLHGSYNGVNVENFAKGLCH